MAGFTAAGDIILRVLHVYQNKPMGWSGTTYQAGRVADLADQLVEAGEADVGQQDEVDDAAHHGRGAGDLGGPEVKIELGAAVANLAVLVVVAPRDLAVGPGVQPQPTLDRRDGGHDAGAEHKRHGAHGDQNLGIEVFVHDAGVRRLPDKEVRIVEGKKREGSEEVR